MRGPLVINMLQTTGMIDSIDLQHSRVFLRPGDWLVGRGLHEVSTLLGSCVSVVMWSPRLQMGGMCHCLLPRRPQFVNRLAIGRTGHYVDEALDWLGNSLAHSGVSLGELQISLAGGGSFADSGIGDANVRAAQDWFAHHGLQPLHCDTGGNLVRKLSWNLGNGALQIATGGRMDAEGA